MNLPIVRIICLIALLLQGFSGFSQDGEKAINPVIQMASTKNLTINNMVLHANVAAEDLLALLGKPDNTREKNGETSYMYENYGIIFSSREGKVKALGVNINWDGDDKFPKTPFSGSLTIGDKLISTTTSNADIAAIKGVEFTCPIPLMCGSKERSAPVNCMMAFGSKDAKITQVIFLLK